MNRLPSVFAGMVRRHVEPDCAKLVQASNDSVPDDDDASRTVSNDDTLRETGIKSMDMSASAILVQAIRGELRHRGMTYRELAARLGVSEPTIKRDLSRGGFSLQRLDGICELLGLSLEDLIRNERSAPAAVTELSRKQESALVADPKLLLTTYLILNNWRFDEIKATFKIDENELVSLLLRLDALQIIEYRPPTRIRKLTARNFSWRKDGPVHRYFVARVLPEFFDESFGGATDAFHFVGATLSEGSRVRLQASMVRLIEEFEQLARADARLPLSARDGCGAVIAFRRWEFSEFTHLRRRRVSSG